MVTKVLAHETVKILQKPFVYTQRGDTERR